jgi:TM2 domain-containing membrane protein YozV
MSSGETNAASGTEKVCPDCAETVQAAAKVCRFCGYRFDSGLSGTTAAARKSIDAAEAERVATAKAAPKSAGGALVLGLVIPGLGNLYVGEVWRGVAYLAAALVSIVAAIATDTIGPGFIIAIISAFDAYNGAHHLNSTGTVRAVTGGVWAVLIVVIVLASIAIGVAANKDDRAATEQPDYQLVPCADHPEAIGCYRGLGEGRPASALASETVAQVGTKKRAERLAPGSRPLISGEAAARSGPSARRPHDANAGARVHSHDRRRF